jgi:hypothetical protein
MKLNEMGQTDPKFISKSTDEASETWMDQKKVELLENLRLKNEGNISGVNSAIAEIKGRLSTLLNENEQRTELEKMERLEFVVDVNGQEMLVTENQRRADTVRISYFKLNSFNELIAARVRHACWDSNSVQSRSLLPLLESENDRKAVCVSSLPIRKCSDDETQTLERIKRLRAVEMRSQRKDGRGMLTKLISGKSRCTWSATIQGCPETVSWLAFDGVRWPCVDVIEMLAEKEKAEAAAGKANKSDAPEEEAETKKRNDAE